MSTILNYGIIPIDSISVSSAAEGYEAINMFDGKLETYWKPDISQASSYTKIAFLKPRLVKAFDIAFHEGDKRRQTFTVEVLSIDSKKWNKINVYQTRGVTTEPERVNIPDVVTKEFKIIYNSWVGNDNHTGILPEVAELRVYGEIEQSEVPSSTVLPRLPCPEGYVLSADGFCIKAAPSEILKPEKVTGTSKSSNKDIEDNEPENVVNEDLKNGYTVIGKESKIVQEFKVTQEIAGLDLAIENKSKAEYNFIINIPDKLQMPVFLQGELESTGILFDKAVNAKTVELVLDNTTDPNQVLKVVKMNILGNVNLEEPKPEEPEPKPPEGEPEPPKPEEGRKQDKGANQDATTWKGTKMSKAEGDFTHKIVDENKVNVADQFTSQDNADAYIKWWQWKQKQGGEVVEPPTTGGNGGTTVEGDETPYETVGTPMDSTFRGPTERHYASGKPNDWTIEKNVKKIPFRNYVYVADITVPPAKLWEHDDNLSMKVGGTHMGTGWFDNSLSVYKGDTGLGNEKKHPSTKLFIVKGKNFGDIRGKHIKIASAYFADENKTNYWVNMGDKWELACEGKDVGGFNPKAKEFEAQLRVDGFAGKDSPPEIHSAKVYEIKVDSSAAVSQSSAKEIEKAKAAAADIEETVCKDEGRT